MGVDIMCIRRMILLVVRKWEDTSWCIIFSLIDLCILACGFKDTNFEMSIRFPYQLACFQFFIK